MNTNEIDRITAEERKALRGYCEPCKLWTPFIRGTDKEVCVNCGAGFTQNPPNQITTQRTPITGKVSKKQERIGA